MIDSDQKTPSPDMRHRLHAEDADARKLAGEDAEAISVAWPVDRQVGLSEVGRVMDLFEEFAANHNLPKRLQLDVALALEEILTNVISYAFQDGSHLEQLPPLDPEDEHKPDISVTLFLHADTLGVTISDCGRKFNPLERATPDTTLDEDERGIGGLGIHLTRKHMDAVEYRRQGNWNILTFSKSTSPEEAS